MPALAIFTDQVTADVDLGAPIQLLSSELFSAIASVGGFEPLPTHGHALVLMADCNSEPAPGVSITANSDDPSTQSFFLYDGLPDPEGIESDENGNGGFLNLPVGFSTVTASVAATGQIYNTKRFLVRAGTISYVPLVPSYLE
jgi:hypothetical protein